MAIWIKTQPVAQTVAIGGTAVFTVEAESNSTPGETLYYQWQWQGVDGTYWGNSELPTANTPTLEVPGTTDRDGQHYRCYITTASGDEATSDVATLTVASITISKQPTDYIGPVGSTAVFSVEATGVGALSYQWQYSSNGGTSWLDSPLSSANTKDFSVPVAENRNGFLYRCIITDSDGQAVSSDSALLSVEGIIITKQPAKYLVVAVGDSITISVEATGVETYQWQYKSLVGIYWSSLPWTGNTTATVTGTTNTNNVNFLYRCKLTDKNGNVVYTDITQAINLETGRGMVKCATIGDIADAIRAKLGISDGMYPEDMAAQIGRIGANSSILMSGAVTVSTSGINDINLGSAFPSTGNFLLCMWLSTGPATSIGYVDGTIIVVSNGTQKIGLSNISSNYWKNAYSTSGTAIDVSTGVVTAGEYYSSLRYRGKFYGTYNWVCIDLAEVGFTV